MSSRMLEQKLVLELSVRMVASACIHFFLPSLRRKVPEWMVDPSYEGLMPAVQW